MPELNAKTEVRCVVFASPHAPAKMRPQEEIAKEAQKSKWCQRNQNI